MSVISLPNRSPSPPQVDQNIHIINYVTQSLCLVFMTIVFSLRVFSRMRILGGFMVEDWLCLGAYVLGMAYSVVALIMGHFGGGLHISDVPINHQVPFAKTVYVTMVMYGPTAFLTKASILVIMIRVFQPYRRAMYFIYAFLALMLTYYIPAVIVKIRICSPVSRFWMGSSVGGSCLDERSIILADAVISVISDLIILLLPFPLTYRLQMATKKKLKVMGLLGAGGLAVASSIVRLDFIVRFGSSPDSTYDFMRINMLGNAEITIGIICACLPSLSVLLAKVAHEYYSSSHSETASTHQMNHMKDPSGEDGSKSTNRHGSPGDIEGLSEHYLSVSRAQGHPSVETVVEPNEGRTSGPLDGFGIVKTVNVSTTYSQRQQ